MNILDLLLEGAETEKGVIVLTGIPAELAPHIISVIENLRELNEAELNTFILALVGYREIKGVKNRVDKLGAEILAELRQQEKARNYKREKYGEKLH
jgi:hypothetical protein